jgi:predicted DNA-binding transcriptional regulator AlpA
MERKLLDIKEVEQRYGLKTWTMRSYCSQRKMPYIKIGRRVFFRVEAIEAWLKEHEKPVQDHHGQ